MKPLLDVPKAVVGLALLLVVVLAVQGCRQKAGREASPGTPLKLTLAIFNAPNSGLVAVADEKGFFSTTRSPEAIKRLLQALIKAEKFTLIHEEETRDIIARKWNFSPEYLRQAWNKTRLNVSFNQSIIISLQNYAKWKMVKEGKAGDPPDVLNYLYPGALDEIDHRLVTFFR